MFVKIWNLLTSSINLEVIPIAVFKKNSRYSKSLLVTEILNKIDIVLPKTNTYPFIFGVSLTGIDTFIGIIKFIFVVILHLHS